MDGAGGEERAASGINGAGGQAAGRPRTGPAQLGHYTPSSSRPHVAATGAQEGNPSTEEEAIASAIVLQGITAVGEAVRAVERIPGLASASRHIAGLPGAVLLERAAKGLWNGVIREVHHASMRNSAEMPSAVGVDEAAEAEAAIEPWTLRYRDPELEHVYLATKWRFHVGALRFIAVVSFIIATMCVRLKAPSPAHAQRPTTSPRSLQVLYDTAELLRVHRPRDPPHRPRPPRGHHRRRLHLSPRVPVGALVRICHRSQLPHPRPGRVRIRHATPPPCPPARSSCTRFPSPPALTHGPAPARDRRTGRQKRRVYAHSALSHADALRDAVSDQLSHLHGPVSGSPCVWYSAAAAL